MSGAADIPSLLGGGSHFGVCSVFTSVSFVLFSTLIIWWRIKAKVKTAYLHMYSGNPERQEQGTSSMFVLDTQRENRTKPGGQFGPQFTFKDFWWALQSGPGKHRVNNTMFNFPHFFLLRNLSTLQKLEISQGSTCDSMQNKQVGDHWNASSVSVDDSVENWNHCKLPASPLEDEKGGLFQQCWVNACYVSQIWNSVYKLEKLISSMQMQYCFFKPWLMY